MAALIRTEHRSFTGEVRTVIITYGVHHRGQPPATTAPVLSLDLTKALRNPADDPALIEMTGLDAPVREHVLTTPGAAEIIEDFAMRILDGYRAANGRRSGQQPWRQDAQVFCKGGRHRSVAVAEATAALLSAMGHGAEVEHLDIGKDVVR